MLHVDDNTLLCLTVAPVPSDLEKQALSCIWAGCKVAGLLLLWLVLAEVFVCGWRSQHIWL